MPLQHFSNRCNNENVNLVGFYLAFSTLPVLSLRINVLNELLGALSETFDRYWLGWDCSHFDGVSVDVLA